jgi:hypothetical protein
MREIEVNLTDSGLEVRFDERPSPRFERYLRNLRSFGRLVRVASRVLVRGPAVAFTVAMCSASLMEAWS